MGAAALPLPPTGSLPPLCRPDTFTEDQEKKNPLPVAPTPPVDSGYVSETENEDAENVKQALEELRCDAFERDFAIRWLTSFVSRAEEMILIPEEARQLATDKAYCILESFMSAPDEEEHEDEGIVRDFAFTLRSSAPSPVTGSCENELRGLHHPARTHVRLPGAVRTRGPRQEGGAAHRRARRGNGTRGTRHGPHAAASRRPAADPLIATDFHPVVLENLRANIASNFPGVENPPVDACHLDWSAPSRAPPLDLPADMLVATDVIYAPEHAVWLRDCASQLLAPDGIFWVLIAVRTNGKFEGISDTVEAAFGAPECPKDAEGRKLSILNIETLAKPDGLGRGDESGYKLFHIGWK
ncbi:Protein-lysine N-methyltransferase EFM2 [Apiospora hydei]|uniref:Protein-lysine N-methyltransferase EFM2 n=1 Tax=Apiospora hydei TaxID=1337664 RepID=A0ABR1UU09_9PEZI